MIKNLICFRVVVVLVFTLGVRLSTAFAQEACHPADPVRSQTFSINTLNGELKITVNADGQTQPASISGLREYNFTVPHKESSGLLPQDYDVEGADFSRINSGVRIDDAQAIRVHAAFNANEERAPEGFQQMLIQSRQKTANEINNFLSQINFNNNTLLAIRTEVSCNNPGDVLRRVIRSDALKTVVYITIIGYCGCTECQAYVTSDNVITVPKIPKDYSVQYVTLIRGGFDSGAGCSNFYFRSGRPNAGIKSLQRGFLK